MDTRGFYKLARTYQTNMERHRNILVYINGEKERNENKIQEKMKSHTDADTHGHTNIDIPPRRSTSVFTRTQVPAHVVKCKNSFQSFGMHACYIVGL